MRFTIFPVLTLTFILYSREKTRFTQSNPVFDPNFEDVQPENLKLYQYEESILTLVNFSKAYYDLRNQKQSTNDAKNCSIWVKLSLHNNNFEVDERVHNDCLKGDPDKRIFELSQVIGMSSQNVKKFYSFRELKQLVEADSHQSMENPQQEKTPYEKLMMNVRFQTIEMVIKIFSFNTKTGSYKFVL